MDILPIYSKNGIGGNVSMKTRKLANPKIFLPLVNSSGTGIGGCSNFTMKKRIVAQNNQPSVPI